MLNNLLFGFDIENIVGNFFTFVLALIVLDILTGLLASAKEKRLSSKVNFNGLIKKTGELIGLVFFTLMDSYFKANGQITKLGVSMLVLYEVLSIIENFSRIGLDFSFISKYFTQSQVKATTPTVMQEQITQNDTPTVTQNNVPFVTQEDYNKGVK